MLGLLTSILSCVANVTIFDLSTIFMAALIPSFLCLNYSDGLIRNKILAGNSKVSVYLSELVTSYLLGLAIWLSYEIPSIIIMSIMGLEKFSLSITEISLYLPVGIVAILGWCSLFTLISMSFKNNRSFVVCLVLTFIYMMSGSLIILSAHGILPGIASDVVLVLCRLLPPQLFIGYGGGWMVVLPLVGGLIIGGISTIIGMLTIKKANLK